MSAVPLVKARLFGELEVEVAGQRVLRLRTRKAALLLAYLLRYPQRHPRAQLLRLFWRGLPQPSARNNLRVTLALLRRVLEPPGVPAGLVLWSGRQSVGLNPDAVETDVARFEEALHRVASGVSAEEQRRLLEYACSLYRGDFLCDFDEPWVVAERERLRQLYESAIHQLGATAPPAHAPVAARPPAYTSTTPSGLGVVLGLESETLLKHRRSWACRVIRTHQGSILGVAPAGLRAFFNSLEGVLKSLATLHQELRECRFALDVGELRYGLGQAGGVPLSTVEQLLKAGSPRQILCTERAALLLPQGTAPVRFTLRHLGCYRLGERASSEQIYQLEFAGREQTFAPLRVESPLRQWLIQVPTTFVGRETERAHLHACLQSGAGSLITLIGAPGVGKSRLALECAWEAEPLFGEARWWLALHSARDSVMEQLAQRLSWEWQGREPFLRSFSAMLTAQPALLVVDTSGGQLSPAQRQELKQLRSAVPTLCCLVTVQTPTELEPEQVFHLEPLPVPPEGASEVEELLRYAAVRLFLERARQVMPDFRLTARNAESVGMLVRLTGGLPLAIELVSARLRSHSPAELVQQLRHSWEWLRGRPTGTLSHSLHTSLTATYQLLPPAIRAFFARLSVFHGGFTLSAAQAVAAPPDAEPSLEELTRLSLVQRDGERYHLLEPVRLFAEMHLHASDEWESTRAAHLRYFCELSEQVGGQITLWEQQLEPERANIEAALEWGLAHAPEQALPLVTALASFWERRGCGDALYSMACQLPQRLTDAGHQLQAARVALSLAIRRRDMTQIESMLHRFLPVADAHPHTLSAGRFWVAAGFHYWMQGDCERSLCSLRRALALFDRHQSLPDQAEALNHLGVALWIRGDLEAANCAFQQALEQASHSSAPLIRLQAMSNLANVLYQQGQHEQAEAFLMAVLQLAQQLSDRRTVATVLTNWGVWLRERGEYARARELCLQASALWQELHEGIGEAAALNNLADTYLHEGDYETAAALFQRSLERILRYRLLWYLPQALQNLAELVQRRGECEQAYQWQLARLYACLAYEQDNQIAPSLQTLAQLALQSNDIEQAARWLMLMEPLTGEPCPPDLLQAVAARLSDAVLESLRQEACRTCREHLVEQLRPLAQAVLAPFEG